MFTLKARKKITLISVTITVFLFLMLLNNYYNPEIYFGWFTIVETRVDNGNYYLVGYHANFDYMNVDERENFKKENESIKIKMKDDYSFNFITRISSEDVNSVNEEQLKISHIWDSIQLNKGYFLLLHKNRFPWNLIRSYTIKEFYDH